MGRAAAAAPPPAAALASLTPITSSSTRAHARLEGSPAAGSVKSFSFIAESSSGRCGSSGFPDALAKPSPPIIATTRPRSAVEDEVDAEEEEAEAEAEDAVEEEEEEAAAVAGHRPRLRFVEAFEFTSII